MAELMKSLGGCSFTSPAVWRLRGLEPNRARPSRVPAGVLISFLGAAGSIFLLGSSLRQHGIGAKGSVPLEWLVILGWNGIGLAMWWAAGRDRARLAPSEPTD